MGLFNHEKANRITDASGNPIANAERRIYPMGSVARAPLFRDPDLTIMQPADMRSDADGYFGLCYLQDGQYRVEIRDPRSPASAPIYAAQNIQVGTLDKTLSARLFETVDQLAADQLLSYTAGHGRLQVQVGEPLHISSANMLYRVMAGDCATPHLVTAGGVRFCEAGTCYTTETRLAQAVARAEPFAAGATVTAGGALFVHSGDGAADLPGHTGWRRVLSPDNADLLAAARQKTDLIAVSEPVNLDVLPALVAASNTYDSVAAGLAGTAEGASFFVAAGPGVQIYRNDAGQEAFIGWHGSIMFETVAELLATDSALPENATIATRSEGFSYRVAAGSATDHQLSAGINKLYLQTGSGVLDLAAWGIDTSGEADVGPILSRALNLALARNVPLRLPPGRLAVRSNVFIDMPSGSRLRVFSDGGTRICLKNINGGGRGITFRSLKGVDTLLSQDAARHDRYLDLTDTTGIETGDLLYLLAPDTAVETGWGYKKNCVRRVAKVQEGRVQLDQALDFFFTVSEGTKITSYKPAHLHLSGVDFEMGMSCAVAFRHMSGMVEDCDAEGPVSGWADSGFSDGFAITGCDQFIMDRCNFRKFRYCPFIGYGSRNIQVRNFRVEKIRHMDANTWAQDVLFENGIGVDTDGIIQCHPCIRPVFRNVHDSVTGGLLGLDLRGMGETVENCSSTSDATGPGHNTNAPLLRADYLDMAAEMTRTIRKFRSPVAAIKGGKEGTLIIEDCQVPFVAASNGHSNGRQKVIIDDATRLTAPHDPWGSRALNNTVSARSGPVRVVPGLSWSASDVGRRITAITQTLPAVATSVGHGLRAGQRILVTELEGMSEMNNRTLRVAEVTAETFTLADDGGMPVDATGYAVYQGGGLAVPLPTPIAISGIDTVLPCRLTCVAHGLEEGDVVYLLGVTGPDALNARFFRIADVTVDRFTLRDVRSGTPVDASGMVGYVAGGTVTRQVEAITLDAHARPNIGFGEKLWMVASIHEELRNI